MPSLSCIYCFYFNKVVVGSGSKGVPKYVGEGDIQGISLVLFTFSHMCVPSDALHQNTRALSYVIMMLHHEMTSLVTSVMSCYDIVMML